MRDGILMVRILWLKYNDRVLYEGKKFVII